ncbi:hypothetical protein GCM10020367_14570 [Streptomyces sannanensis]|uniref:Uncharacterized protein n=1 Tax=Streptomyces sannanensis TaxID=285536 RepID=A0ABP6S8F1_9ACTN
MPGDRPTLPPVRLQSDAELARHALGAPLLAGAVRLARWAGPGVQAGDGELPAEVAESGLGDLAGAAWRAAVGTGLVETGDGSVASTGENLALLTRGSPRDVLGIWRDALETVFAGIGPREEAEFLEHVLGKLYLLTVTEGAAGDGPVPLPALAASVIVPDGMGRPTDDILQQVSDAMMRLDAQFRLLEPTGLVAYHPVDDALMAEEDEDTAASAEEEVSRYGMVRLTPLGLYGVRARLLEAGFGAPAVGDLVGKGADALLDGIAHYPDHAARAETVQWLAGREPGEAAADLLAAARGADPLAPLRRLHCHQTLSAVGTAAEPAVRAVLDDSELGGLARVWLAERGATDVPPPPEPMVFWLAIDTIAAQLAAQGDLAELQGLVEGLTGRHNGFLATAWRVDHPATADVLEAMGRIHPHRETAKDARRAAFKARSRV